MAEEEQKKKLELGGRIITPSVEDVVQALMDHLVEPVLPIVRSYHTHSSFDLSLQQSIAKQMHAVVLLYNFYHRKQFPQLEFLDFESFCKVAVIAKPSLIAHLNHMQNCHDDRQFKDKSVTEEAIIDACNISKSLATLENSPSMEGWPISKIAVFLTDSLMENCWLVYSARTEGVWSPIEKYEIECSDNSEGMFGAKQKSETKRTVTRPVRFQNANETHMQELAMAAVKDATGIDPKELVILERHLVYSLSEEKTTVRLFIIKCKSVKGDGFQVPIKDAIDSLQGPLVKQSCNSYVAADVIEYFHLLPYAGRLAARFSRKTVANGSELRQEANLNQKFSQKNEDPVKIVANINSGDSSDTSQVGDLPVLKTNDNKNMNQMKDQDCCVIGIQNIGVDKSSRCSDPSWEKEATIKDLADYAGIKFSSDGDLQSPKSSTATKNNMNGSMREACHNGVNMDNTQSSVHVGADRNVPIIASEEVLLVNNCEHLDGDGSSPSGAHKFGGSSFGRKHVLDVGNGVDNLGNGEGIHEGGDDVMLKELENIKFPANEDPDRTLDLNDKSLLTEAILKVWEAEKTSSMIKKVYACKVWGETEDIRDEILTQRNEFLGQLRKRQRICYHDCTSAIDVDTCRGEVVLKSDKKMNSDVERLDTSLVRCDDVGHVLRDRGSESPMIPLQKDVWLAESVCFSRQYMELYKRIVERFGDILKPESMEATACSDIVSATMNGLFEVIDSMLQASPQTVNAQVLESWELKLQFCELAGLKVGWLRDHFERIRQACSSSSRIQELEGRASLTVKCLESKSKRVADLLKELECALAEEKALLEEKRVIDTDLAAARHLADHFSFSLF